MFWIVIRFRWPFARVYTVRTAEHLDMEEHIKYCGQINQCLMCGQPSDNHVWTLFFFSLFGIKPAKDAINTKCSAVSSWDFIFEPIDRLPINYSTKAAHRMKDWFSYVPYLNTGNKLPKRFMNKIDFNEYKCKDVSVICQYVNDFKLIIRRIQSNEIICPLKWFNIHLIAFRSFTPREISVNHEHFHDHFVEYLHRTHRAIWTFQKHKYIEISEQTKIQSRCFSFHKRGANALYNKVHCSVGSKIAKVHS